MSHFDRPAVEETQMGALAGASEATPPVRRHDFVE
jgi:hypothetical protein